jgi:hypothetical protein
MLCHYAECRYAECHVPFIILLNIIMLSVVTLNVVMLSVVAPEGTDSDKNTPAYYGGDLITADKKFIEQGCTQG